MAIIENENPKLSMDELSNLKKKVENKIASSDDFEKLDYFLSSTGSTKLISEKLKEFNLNSYAEYFKNKNNMPESLISEIDKNIQGISLGIISFLKTYLSR